MSHLLLFLQICHILYEIYHIFSYVQNATTTPEAAVGSSDLLAR